MDSHLSPTNAAGTEPPNNGRLPTGGWASPRESAEFPTDVKGVVVMLAGQGVGVLVA